MLYIVIGVLTFIGMFIGVVLVVYNRINNYYRQFVTKNSITLKKLNELNKKNNFHNIMNLDEKHIYDNEKIYDNIACIDYLVYQLQFKQYEILRQIDRVANNRKMYEEYRKQVKQIQEFGKFIQPINKLHKRKLLTIEKDLFKQNELHPQTSFSIQIELYRSDINGRIFSGKSDDFDSDQIKQLIRKLNNKSGNFYKDRDIWDSICKVERGKVSNKMRFSIYKRDEYRCCKCGRSGNMCDLEIDHIKPIAKGGKSTYDNLQTLCHRCNQQKGDTY